VFTNLLNLLQELSDRFSQQDQILSLSGMSWTDYENLTAREDSGYRISYLNGIITILSPSRNHERIAEIINGLIKTYCRKYSLVYFPMGSTTLKNPPLSGKEPDHSFAFKTDKAIPDLAIDVNYTNGSVVDLERYRDLGIQEVWMWKDRQISFYHLVDSEYQEITESVCLPTLKTHFLITFVNRGLKETPLTIEEDFYRKLK
jgi:Uma2 family endonuclease